MLEGAKLIGAGAATIALAGAAIGIGNVFSSLIHSSARHPSLAKQLFGYATLYIYMYLFFDFPKKWDKIRFVLSVFLLGYRFLILLFPMAMNIHIHVLFHGDDDLWRAVEPFISRGEATPVTLPEQDHPLFLSMEEEEEIRLGVVLDYQARIGALLQTLSNSFAQESAEDLAAATLLHKDEDLNDPDKLWVVHEGLLRDGHSSRYYFRAIDWVRAERQVRNGDLPLTFIIEDDGAEIGSPWTLPRISF